MPKLNEKIQDFSLLLTGNQDKQLSDYLGKWLILYFYPRANTPGCTLESQEFTAKYDAFKALNVEILGVSADSLKKQENFKTKYEFKFDLVADTEEQLCQYFDVIKEKNMYGKTFMGIERSTFLIDPDGRLVQEWRKVKVKGHVDEVYDSVVNKS